MPFKNFLPALRELSFIDFIFFHISIPFFLTTDFIIHHLSNYYSSHFFIIFPTHHFPLIAISLPIPDLQLETTLRVGGQELAGKLRNNLIDLTWEGKYSFSFLSAHSPFVSCFSQAILSTIRNR